MALFATACPSAFDLDLLTLCIKVFTGSFALCVAIQIVQIVIYVEMRTSHPFCLFCRCMALEATGEERGSSKLYLQLSVDADTESKDNLGM